jgi:hypothetical protein
VPERNVTVQFGIVVVHLHDGGPRRGYRHHVRKIIFVRLDRLADLLHELLLADRVLIPLPQVHVPGVHENVQIALLKIKRIKSPRR